MTRSKKPLQALVAFVAFVGLGPVACSLGSYDYLSAGRDGAGAGLGASAGAGAGAGGSGNAGGTPTAGSAGEAGDSGDVCQDQTDGSPCDDRDVCTLSSLCIDGLCQGSGDHPCTVADTVHEFAMTQGVQGFWYGAWAAGNDADGIYSPATEFEELLPCPEQNWRRACVMETDPSFRWTLIIADLQHAATTPVLDVAVRRWVSDVSGPAMAALDHHHADPGDGDGTRAQLLLDGAAVWENEINGLDLPGTQVEIPVELERGMLVELVLHPRANQARDMTYLTLVLRGM